jgi:hypothetical protein
MDESPSSSSRSGSPEPVVEVAGIADGAWRLEQVQRLERLLTTMELRAGLLPRPNVSDRPEIEVEDHPTTIPEVRECNWKTFVNRFDPDEPVYSIDVLVAGPKVYQDIQAEARSRGGMEMRIMGTRPSSHRVHRLENNSQWIHRVRIQSPLLLAIFSRITGYDWGTQSHTFMRPFPDIIYRHDKLKEELRTMESEGDAGPEQPANLADLRCYIDFVESRILPDYTRICKSPESNRPRILFSDLWYLFRPGDLIYVPPRSLVQVAAPSPRAPDMPGSRLASSKGESPWHQCSLLRAGRTAIAPRIPRY